MGDGARRAQRTAPRPPVVDVLRHQPCEGLRWLHRQGRRPRPGRARNMASAAVPDSRMNRIRPHRRSDLVRIATEAMIDRGLEPEFPAGVTRQLSTITGAGRDAGPQVRDLTQLPWCSIDNDDSLDLDQLTACEPLAGGAVKVYVAVADVDALVKKGSAIDEHARINTTSVYTSARVFPMLPERLSTDLTSLNAGQDRLALVTTMTVNEDGCDRALGGRTRHGAQQGQARLRRGVGVDRWCRRTARSGCRGAGHGPAAQDAGCRRATPARATPCAGLARAGDLPAACGVRRRACGRHPSAGAKPCSPVDRRVHDRDQRLHGPVSGRRRRCVVAPRGAFARALAAHRRGGAQVRRDPAAAARFAGARGLPGQAPPCRPAALSRSVAGRRSS